MSAQRFRYYRGVRYVAAGREAPAAFARCGSCGRAWDDDKPMALTPVPSARCPFEGMRNYRKAERARILRSQRELCAARNAQLTADIRAARRAAGSS